MEFRLLGPVEVRAGGRLVDAGPRRQRTVLAALAADAGRPVMVDTVVDRVWGEAPPDRVRHALYVYIARLRAMIAEANASAGTTASLVRRSGGYLLEVEPDRVDVHRFRRLVDQARDPQCQDGKRAALLGQALELWRGPPLADLPGEWAARVREGWQQQHLDAVVWWAQTELRLGNGTAVVGPLTDMVGDYPLVESLVGALMRALHAVGRGVDALDCYAAARQRLAEQLGADPGAELRGLHQAILRGDLDEVPAAPATGPVTAAPAPAVPAQLPLDVRGFAGRDGALAVLDGILAAADQPATVAIGVLSGTAGVGKTALAVRWAHRVASRFPDGQLYANLRGFDPGGPAMTPAEAVRTFLDALGVAPQRVPESLAAQVGLYRSLLAGRRVLVVLDNARDAEQVRPLLPGSAGCLVLVTSRNQLPGLVAAEGAHPVTVDLLPAAEARELLARRIGRDRVAAEPAAAEEIIARCARLPLALAIVAAQAVTNPGFPLDALAGQLRAARGGLDAFTGEDAATDVRALFSWSYHTLGGDAGRLFRRLGLHPGPDLGTAAAASLAGVPLGQARRLLAELTRAHLITEHTPGRYTFHDLLRAYATELAHALDPAADRRATVHRMLDHYLHTAHAADRLLYPYRDPLALAAPVPGATTERPADIEHALAWFTTEHPVLLATVRRAAEGGFDAHAWQLAGTFGNFFDRRGHWHDWLATQRIALDAARRLADRTGQAHAHRGLGLAHRLLGRDDEAHTHLRHALDLYRELGDDAGQGRTHLNVGWLYERQGRHRDALRHAEQALHRYRAAGHRVGQARALNGIGWCHGLLGDHQQTLVHCRQALALHQELGDPSGAANTWDSLGYAHHQLGQHPQAAECYRQAIDLFREDGDRYGEADVLVHLGDTHDALGDLDTAQAAWRDALAILTDIGHPDAEDLRAKLRQTDVRR